MRAMLGSTQPGDKVGEGTAQELRGGLGKTHSGGGTNLFISSFCVHLKQQKKAFASR